MKYKNTKTGAVIDTPCKIKGENWIEVEEEKEVEKEVEIKEKEDIVELSKMAIADLKKFAFEFNIDLGNATKRDDIIKAIMESDAVELE